MLAPTTDMEMQRQEARASSRIPCVGPEGGNNNNKKDDGPEMGGHPLSQDGLGPQLPGQGGSCTEVIEAAPEGKHNSRLDFGLVPGGGDWFPGSAGGLPWGLEAEDMEANVLARLDGGGEGMSLAPALVDVFSLPTNETWLMDGRVSSYDDFASGGFGEIAGGETGWHVRGDGREQGPVDTQELPGGPVFQEFMHGVCRLPSAQAIHDGFGLVGPTAAGAAGVAYPFSDAGLARMSGSPAAWGTAVENSDAGVLTGDGGAAAGAWAWAGRSATQALPGGWHTHRSQRRRRSRDHPQPGCQQDGPGADPLAAAMAAAAAAVGDSSSGQHHWQQGAWPQGVPPLPPYLMTQMRHEAGGGDNSGSGPLVAASRGESVGARASPLGPYAGQRLHPGQQMPLWMGGEDDPAAGGGEDVTESVALRDMLPALYTVEAPLRATVAQALYRMSQAACARREGAVGPPLAPGEGETTAAIDTLVANLLYHAYEPVGGNTPNGAPTAGRCGSGAPLHSGSGAATETHARHRDTSGGGDSGSGSDDQVIQGQRGGSRDREASAEDDLPREQRMKTSGRRVAGVRPAGLRSLT